MHRSAMSLAAGQLCQASALSTTACLTLGAGTRNVRSRRSLLRPHLHSNRVGDEREGQAGDGVEAAPGVVDAFDPATIGAGNREVRDSGVSSPEVPRSDCRSP
ncbi:hypothetical protein NJ76_28010, partial [Rhodococcus sp. IITR03]